MVLCTALPGLDRFPGSVMGFERRRPGQAPAARASRRDPLVYRLRFDATSLEVSGARTSPQRRITPAHTMLQIVGIQQRPVPTAAPHSWLVVPVARLVTLMAQTAPTPASAHAALVEHGVGLHVAPAPLQ